MKITHKCKICFQEFSPFFPLRQYKTSELGIQIKAAEFDVNNLLEDDDAHLKEELKACQQFLVDSELQKGRHRVFNFAMSTFDNYLVKKEFCNNLVFKGLKCAAKVDLAFGFVLKNVEDRSCRGFYTHESNTVIERSKLVCTPDEITNLKEKLQKMDSVDLCTRQRANTKWKFYKLTNLTIFAALLKEIPMGCKDSVLAELPLKNQNVNCLVFEKKNLYNDSLCLFRAFALHLFGNERLEEETSKIINLILNNCGERDPSEFQGVHRTDILKGEEMLQLNSFLYDNDFVDGELVRELARRSIQKLEKSVKLLRYNNHICYVSDIELLIRFFSMQRMSHNLFKCWNFGATFDYM